MESSKYNIDNFERFLRDKTDEFRMYPSKRVWYSIYNNMHPGTRLPSLSMCILLIFSLFLVGYLNTGTGKQVAAANNISKSEVNYSLPDVATSLTTVTGSVETGGVIKQPLTAGVFNRLSQLNNHSKAGSNKTVVIANNPDLINNKKQGHLNSSAKHNNIAIASFADNDLMNGNAVAVIKAMPSEIENAETDLAASAIDEINTESNTDFSEVLKNKITASVEQNNLVADNAAPAFIIASAAKSIDDAKTKKVSNKAVVMYQADKAWIEDFALHNKPVAKKWAGKLSWLAYITPSVVYRQLHNNATDKTIAGNNNYNNVNVDKMVTHKPSFGAETGVSLQYDVVKKLRLKAGVQFNYTRYNAHAYENFHPIGTSILMNNDNGTGVYELFATSPYSNLNGLTLKKLHNETYQLSIPLGADIRLAAVTDNISWYAGATVQPTYIAYGKSYIISSDRKSYVDDRTLLNRFNLNAGFETYLSLKTDNYTLQLGPQFRSQIFSTNTKLYTVEERLMNFGFKVGISKKF
jgi:hypothetical protein